jgi:hypothetical protein
VILSICYKSKKINVVIFKRELNFVIIVIISSSETINRNVESEEFKTLGIIQEKLSYIHIENISFI